MNDELCLANIVTNVFVFLTEFVIINLESDRCMNLKLDVDLIGAAVVLGDNGVSAGVRALKLVENEHSMIILVLNFESVHALQYRVLEFPRNDRRWFTLDVGLEPQHLADSHNFLLKILAINVRCHCKQRAELIRYKLLSE